MHSKQNKMRAWLEANHKKAKFLDSEPVELFNACAKAMGVTTDTARRTYRKMSISNQLSSTQKVGMSLSDFKATFDPEVQARDSIRKNLADLTEDVQIIPDNDFRSKWCHCSTNYWRDAAAEFTANQFQYRGKVYWAHKNIIQQCLKELEGSGVVE